MSSSSAVSEPRTATSATAYFAGFLDDTAFETNGTDRRPLGS